jgi:hypothetical protein
MSKLTQELHRIWGPRRHASPAAEAPTQPSSFEQVTRSKLDDLGRQADRLEARLNGLLLALAGAIIAEIVRTLAH